MQQQQQLHIVMFPYFAFGHISPFVRLSNELASHGVRISLLSATGNITRIRSSLKLTPAAEIVPLEIPRVEGLPPGLDNTAKMTPSMAELLKKALDLMQPQIKERLSELKPHFLFFDFAHHWIPQLASQLGIKAVRFSVFSAISDAYVTVPARIDLKINPSADKLKNPPEGFPLASSATLQTFQANEFFYLFKSFDGGPCVFDRIQTSINGCSALAFKTCKEMEGHYVDYIKRQFKIPVLLTGPLVPDLVSDDDESLDSKWSSWLGKFPAKSVIFCSFGSETFLKDHEIKELAHGLELTNLPFILVLNFPTQVDVEEKLKSSLPEGFLERVKDRGVVHTGWVQQQLILAHNSVGCYLSHSGFSSVIEAIVSDCQLVCLPFNGDQFLNAKLVGGDMKAGVEVCRSDEDGEFTEKDIFEAIRIVMLDTDEEPGKSIKASHAKWREFLLDKEIQGKYVEDLMRELQALK